LCLLYCDLARLFLSLRTTNLTFTLYVLLSWCYVLVYMYVCMCTMYLYYNLYISLMKLTRVILFPYLLLFARYVAAAILCLCNPFLFELIKNKIKIKYMLKNMINRIRSSALEKSFNSSFYFRIFSI